MSRKGWNPHAHDNLTRGARAESKVKRAYEDAGWSVRRHGWGADFKATKNGSTRFIEVKTTSGKLTPRQKAMRRRHGNAYHIEYVKGFDVPASNAMRIRPDGHSEMDPWAWSRQA